MDKHSFGARLWRCVDSIDTMLSVSALVMLVFIVSLQVFCRYVLQNSLAWTEELARYLLIWSVLLGCSYAMKEDAHLQMAVLRNMLGPKAGLAVCIFSYAMSFVFCLIMINAGMESIENIRWSEQTTPAMGIPAWLIWLGMPLGFGLMGVHALLCLVKETRELFFSPSL